MKLIKEESAHLKKTFSKEDNLHFYKRLKEDIPWAKAEWTKGKYLPRLVYRHDFGHIQVLDDLKEQCELTFQCRVRGIWCNLYRDGKDYTPPHQDNYGAHVITYSFGATRRFACENIKTKKKEEYLLDDGDIFYFSPEFDKNHKHSILKTNKKVGPRISIVFFTPELYSSNLNVNHESAIMQTNQESVLHLEMDGIIMDDETLAVLLEENPGLMTALIESIYGTKNL